MGVGIEFEPGLVILTTQEQLDDLETSNTWRPLYLDEEAEIVLGKNEVRMVFVTVDVDEETVPAEDDDPSGFWATAQAVVSLKKAVPGKRDCRTFLPEVQNFERFLEAVRVTPRLDDNKTDFWCSTLITGEILPTIGAGKHVEAHMVNVSWIGETKPAPIQQQRLKMCCEVSVLRHRMHPGWERSLFAACNAERYNFPEDEVRFYNDFAQGAHPSLKVPKEG